MGNYHLFIMCRCLNEGNKFFGSWYVNGKSFGEKRFCIKKNDFVSLKLSKHVTICYSSTKKTFLIDPTS